MAAQNRSQFLEAQKSTKSGETYQARLPASKDSRRLKHHEAFRG